MKSKVLVADDSPTIQKVIDITLANEPCELDQALSVEQLFEQLDANHYNLVLLDFCLSEEMNGFDLAQKMVGIYKTHDVTRTLTINPTQMTE